MDNCEFCGREVPSNQIVVDVDSTERVHLVCTECIQYWDTCPTCVNGMHCAFDEDQSGIPKAVMKTVQQGNMVMQAQVRNPELIEKTCKTCPCFDEKIGCARQNMWCGSYEPPYQPKEYEVISTDTEDSHD